MRFHLDEQVDSAVAVGLRRRGVDVSTTGDAQLIGASDERQLAFARTGDWVVVTQDADFLRLASGGMSHAGIVYARQGTGVGRIVEHLMLIHLCLSEADMQDHIEFI
jgi:predicted nuclease of predicted toxin-antitoxin system